MSRPKTKSQCLTADRPESCASKLVCTGGRAVSLSHGVAASRLKLAEILGNLLRDCNKRKVALGGLSFPCFVDITLFFEWLGD
jgi:hypothetical protein